MNEKEYYTALLNSAVPSSNAVTSSDAAAMAGAEANAPTGYVGTHQAQVDSAVNNYLSQNGLTGYSTSKDKDYQAYRQAYTEAAQKAADNAVANAGALSGGYGSASAGIVASEGKSAQMENIADAVPAFRSAEGNVELGKMTQAANSVGLMSQLDTNEYTDAQNAESNYLNYLGHGLNRYSADAQLEAQRNSNEATVYNTKLDAAQQNLADQSSYYNNLYNYNTQSAENAAQIAEDEYENNQKNSYTAAKDKYDAHVATAKAQATEDDKRVEHNSDEYIKAYNLTKNTDYTYATNQIAVGYYHGYISIAEVKKISDKLNISTDDIAEVLDTIEKNGGTLEKEHGR